MLKKATLWKCGRQLLLYANNLGTTAINTVFAAGPLKNAQLKLFKQHWN